MYTVNMFGNQGGWWKNRNVAKAIPVEKYKPPTKCTFCGKKIEDGDFFYAGYDGHRIYSETCDNIRCHQWFTHKVRKKRIDYNTCR